MRTKENATTPTKTHTVRIMGLILAACLSLAGAAMAQDGLVSTMELMEGITAIDGIRIVKPDDRSGTVYTEDYGPSQVLEIIRPNMGPITVGRLSTSCTCISAIMEKKTFGQGERAFIEVRNVKQSQPAGATYAVWAQLVSPYRAALQFEMFVKSDRKPGDPLPASAAAPVAAPAAAPAPVSKPAAAEPAPAVVTTDEAPAASSSAAIPPTTIPATDTTPEIIVPVADETTKTVSSSSQPVLRSSVVEAALSSTSSSSSSAVSSGGGSFRYEDIAPYKPKSSEDRAVAEAAAVAEAEQKKVASPSTDAE